MANEKNLKPFKKGFDERRNLEGVPKKILLTDAIDNVDKDWLNETIKACIKQAKKGNIKAIQELWDRYYGKSGQKIELANAEGTSGFKLIVENKEDADKIKDILES